MKEYLKIFHLYKFQKLAKLYYFTDAYTVDKNLKKRKKIISKKSR